MDVPFSVGTVWYSFILLHIFAKLIEFIGGARQSENHQNIVLFTCKGLSFCSRIHLTQLSTCTTVLHPPRVDSLTGQWIVKTFKCFMIFPRGVGIISGKFPPIAFLSRASFKIPKYTPANSSVSTIFHTSYKVVSCLLQNGGNFIQGLYIGKSW